MLRMPLMRNTADQLKPISSSTAWIREEWMKHRAVMGMKMVRL